MDGYGRKYCSSGIEEGCQELKWWANDIVSIKLGMKQRNIEYFVNNKSIAISFENIPIGKRY